MAPVAVSMPPSGDDMGSDSNFKPPIRHQSVGNRKFALYASRIKDSEITTTNSNPVAVPQLSPTTDATPSSPTPTPTSSTHAMHGPQSYPNDNHDDGYTAAGYPDEQYSDFHHAQRASDSSSFELSQLPPLPLSPRWDSLSNSSRFFLQGFDGHGGTVTASNSTPTSPLEPQPPQPQAQSQAQPRSPPRAGDATSIASDSRTVSPTFPLASRTSLTELHDDSPKSPKSPKSPVSPIENFSRPRKLSIRQPITETAKPRPAANPNGTGSNFIPAADAYQELISSSPWSRPRGPSVSSCKSSATFASTSVLPPPRPTGDFYEPRPSRARATTTAATPSPKPPLTFANRLEYGSSPPPVAVVAPWMTAEELRSSFRSQLTESTAPGTAATERSSVITKDSSVTSLYEPVKEVDEDPDEPSLEDVMGMYEKGFEDDDSDGNNTIDSRPGTSTSYHHGYNNRHSHNRRDTPEPMIDIVEPEASATEPVSPLDREIRMSKMIFTSPEFTASVSHIAQNLNRKSFDKRDSGKSLDSDPSISSRQPSPVNAISPISPPTSPPPLSSPSISPSPVSSHPVFLPPAVEPEDPESRDRYGFKKANQYITREQYDKWNSGYTEYLARRRKKWTAYLKDNALMTDEPNRFPSPNAKTKRFIRKGIPPDWRGAAWFYYAGGPAILAQHSGLYDKLTTKTAKEVDVEAIERDLHRTFPDNLKFKPPGSSFTTSSSERGSQSTMTDSTRSISPLTPPGSENEPPIITSLRRVLHAFSVYNPQIGYCQSLNFLAGLLLLFVDTEEQCFWLLNVITRIYLPGTHELSLEGSKVDLGVLMTELRDTMPAVWDKVGGELEAEPTPRPATSKSIRLPRSRRRDLSRLSTERLPPITVCMTAWFMSCFIGTLPIETTLRVWDVFFYEGSKTLFRIALAIFKLGEAEIKAVSDPMEMFGVVQSLPRRLIDANGLMDACFKRRNGFGHLSQEAIDVQREERRNKAQLDRLRQGKASDNWNTGPPAADTVQRRGTLFRNSKKRAGTAQ